MHNYNGRSLLEFCTLSKLEFADARLQRLTEWSATALGRKNLQISVASADASFRRYFRVHGELQTWIVMDAPPEKEDTTPFIKVSEMLVNAGVNAPEVLAQNLAEGYLLLSDLGSRTYLTALADREQAGGLYADAIDALVRMQIGCAPRVRELPPYDAALLKREVELFPDWFVMKHLGLTLAAAERAVLDSAFSILIDAALAQPRVFVHRDYHSRNLMATDRDAQGSNPGILDFQDAVHGPITYDLVSLLRDCYVAWPAEQVHGWLREFRSRAQSSGLDVGASEPEFVRWFDLMGMQRHLKAIGIFARLAHRDGKHGYLPDIPRTLNYIREVLPSYAKSSELRAFAELIEARIAPALGRT
jgi:aminoglycoside/choline kinase family phosphotransferase